MQSPRDLREWQKSIEMGIKDAKRGTRLAIDHADTKAGDVSEEISNLKDLTPAAPIEVTYQTSVYVDQNKRRRGKITADFPDVTLSTTAEPVGISGYELSGQDQGQNPLGPWRSLGGNDTSTIDAFDLNPGSTWKLRVRAIAGSTIRPGEWSSEQTVTVVADTTPPPQPSTPSLTTNGGAITVKWDGKDAGGNAMPGDFDHIDIAFGMATSPTTIVSTLYDVGLYVQPKVSYNTPHYFRFRAVDTSGNISAWSAQATGIPTPLVDADLILSNIDAAVTTITNIGAQAIKDGAINSAKLADNAVSQAKLQDQIISLSKLDTNANAKIQKGVDDAFAAQSAANTADSKAVTAQNAANTANTAAGTAQTAADKPQAMADADRGQGREPRLNGDFEARSPACSGVLVEPPARHCEVDARHPLRRAIGSGTPRLHRGLLHQRYRRHQRPHVLRRVLGPRLARRSVITGWLPRCVRGEHHPAENTTNTVTVATASPFTFSSVTTGAWTKCALPTP